MYTTLSCYLFFHCGRAARHQKSIQSQVYDKLSSVFDAAAEETAVARRQDRCDPAVRRYLDQVETYAEHMKQQWMERFLQAKEGMDTVIQDSEKCIALKYMLIQLLHKELDRIQQQLTGWTAFFYRRDVVEIKILSVQQAIGRIEKANDLTSLKYEMLMLTHHAAIMKTSGRIALLGSTIHQKLQHFALKHF